MTCTLGSDAAPDEALLAQIARGDLRAVAALYDRYAAAIFPTAFQIVRSREEAEDLIHDAFVIVAERAAQFDPQRGSVAAWLVVMVRNLSIDRLRGRRRRAGLDRLRLETEPSAPGETPESQSSDAEARASVRRAVSALPSSQRMTLERAFFEGLTYREIAAREGVSVGTVKSRAQRGLESLREALREEERGSVRTLEHAI